MPPKVKILREDIVDAAVGIVREKGADALNARSVAATLHCSTQPVFSNFATMDELRLAVVAAADALYQARIRQETEAGRYPAYKSAGMAYIRFAKEEKDLFKPLYMRDRTAETIPETDALTDRMQQLVQADTALGGEESLLLHVEMWAFVHGIATILATGFMELDMELISRMLTDAYQGLKKRFEKE